MTSTILAFVLTALFLFLSFLHIYWALGGQWSIEKIIPEKFKESFYNSKSKTGFMLATFVVAFGLMSIAWLTAAYVGKMKSPFSHPVHRYLLMVVSGLFLLRAIGDFNMVGLFKSQKIGLFAYWDSKLFVPLCFCISAAYVLLLLL